MKDVPFDVKPHRFESGPWAQYITIQNPESDQPWGLFVCTVDGERDAQTMSNGLRAMLQRAYEAGRASAAADPAGASG
jgi:hypothetical protein